MIIHVYDWIDSLANIINRSNYTIHSEGEFCISANNQDVTVFSTESFIPITDQEEKIMENFFGSVELSDYHVKNYKNYNGACFKLKLPLKD